MNILTRQIKAAVATAVMAVGGGDKERVDE